MIDISRTAYYYNPKDKKKKKLDWVLLVYIMNICYKYSC
jgi:hypothetical protein